MDCYFLSTIKKDNISPIVPLVLPFNENNTNRTLPKVKWIAISLPTLFPQKDTDFIWIHDVRCIKQGILYICIQYYIF